MIAPSVYRLILCEDDGRQIAIAECPLLPRFIHIHEAHDDDGAAMWEASDDAEPGDNVCHCDTYARVGSSVWVTGEDGAQVESKDALFVRVVVL